MRLDITGPDSAGIIHVSPLRLGWLVVGSYVTVDGIVYRSVCAQVGYGCDGTVWERIDGHMRPQPGWQYVIASIPDSAACGIVHDAGRIHAVLEAHVRQAASTTPFRLQALLGGGGPWCRSATCRAAFLHLTPTTWQRVLPILAASHLCACEASELVSDLDDDQVAVLTQLIVDGSEEPVTTLARVASYL